MSKKKKSFTGFLFALHGKEKSKGRIWKRAPNGTMWPMRKATGGPMKGKYTLGL